MLDDHDDRRREPPLLKSLYRQLRRVPKQLRWRLSFEREQRAAAGRVQPGVHPVIVVLDHLFPGYNPGQIVRNADAFGAREVHAVGTWGFNPGPAVGSLANVVLRPFDDMAACHAALKAEGYAIFALEPARSVSEVRHLHQVELPEKSAFIVGNERNGVSFAPEDFPDIIWVSIAQFGRVPCLNASTASAVALYEYTRRHG